MIVDYVTGDTRWFRSNQRGEKQNKNLLQMRTRRSMWRMLMLTKSEGGNKENELVARHDCSSSRRTRLTRTNAKPGARIHEARARATLNNAGRVSGGCVCVLKMLTAEKMVGGHKRN